MKEMTGTERKNYGIFLVILLVFAVCLAASKPPGSTEFVAGIVLAVLDMLIFAYYVRGVYFTRSIIIVPDPETRQKGEN